MDKEILEILKRLDEGQKKLVEGQKRFDEHLKRLDDGQKRFDEQLKGLNEGQKRLETKLDEHTQILRALEHSAEVNKAEHDKMFNDMAKIQGDVTGIKKGLSQVEIVTANNWADLVKLKAIQ